MSRDVVNGDLDLGAAGRAFAEAELDQDAIFQRLEAELLRCLAKPSEQPASP